MTMHQVLREQTTSQWMPLLDGDAADRALTTAKRILRDSAAATAPIASPLMLEAPDNPSLATGGAGLALSFAYAADRFDASANREAAFALLRQGLDKAVKGAANIGFFGGITGYAWVVEHLHRKEVIPAGDVNDHVDGYIQRVLGQQRDTLDADLVNGLVGIGIYAAERLPRPAAEELVGRVVAALRHRAVQTRHGAYWPMPEWVQKEYKEYKLNFSQGMAHGSAGVIALLAALHGSGVRVPGSESLLDAAISWLLHARDCESDVPGKGRPSWCWGEPGVAIALLRAGRATGMPEWHARGLALAREIAHWSQDQVRFNDSCLCHGVSGFAHVLNRMYQLTREPDIGASAKTWVLRLLDCGEVGARLAGYVFFDGTMQGAPRFVNKTGFFTGSGGVALTLLAASGAERPDWDRAMLLAA